jgi:TusA-related sulfurtransferase
VAQALLSIREELGKGIFGASRRGVVGKQRATRCLDMRSSIRPIALLEAAYAFRKLNSGETLEILVSDPYTKECIFKVLPASRYEVVGTAEERSFWRILLRKEI